MSNFVAGIDFGTTTSCISYYNKESKQVQVIPNEQGNFTSPSILFLDSESSEMLFSDSALQLLYSNNNQHYLSNIFNNLKRLVSKTCIDATLLPFFKHNTINSTTNQITFDIIYNNKQESLNVSTLITFYLKYLKLLLCNHFSIESNTTLEIVLTVPAYFDDHQRTILKDCCESIGLLVLRIINEPTAASLAYALDKHKQLDTTHSINEEFILTFDCGGGTTDISLLHLDYIDSIYEVKNTVGDNLLGGEDITNNLVNFIAQKLKLENLNNKTLNKIKKQAEDAKKQLSFSQQTTIYLEIGDNDYTLTISQSQFNDINRTNSFDSDIWNSTECFTDADTEPFRSSNTIVTVADTESVTGINIYYFNDNNSKSYELYEITWIKEIFGKAINLTAITSFLELVPDNSWFIVQRPHLQNFNKYFSYLQAENINFKVLHLCDEFSSDDLKFYTYTNCKGVIRNYIRSDVSSLSHITTIPIGFHYKGTNTKTFDERSMVWSFHGTDWFNRKETLEKLQVFVPNNCHFTNCWNDPKMTNESKYLNALSNSKFCPILRGNNIETFRLYEALETGTIPIYVRLPSDAEFWDLISKKLQLINLDTWEKAIEFINVLINKKEFGEKYRLTLVDNWKVWKNEIKLSCQKLQ